MEEGTLKVVFSRERPHLARSAPPFPHTNPLATAGTVPAKTGDQKATKGDLKSVLSESLAKTRSSGLLTPGLRLWLRWKQTVVEVERLKSAE